MKTKKPAYKFVEWSSPEELHEASIDWISELEFIKDEQKFLDSLIKNHTLKLISKELFQRSQKVVTELSNEEKQVNNLLKRVKLHVNKLEILVDGIDQKEEEDRYKEDHYVLKIKVLRYLDDFKKTKRSIFELISSIMKQVKRKQLSS